MSRSGRTFGALAIVLALAASVTLAGCSKPKQAAVKPKVAPPAVAKAGVLRAGIDMSYPPFGGTDNGKQAGIDVDVASAIAGKLGVKVELVDVRPSDAATALASNKADVVFSVPITAESLSGAGMAGTYIADGPALFVARSGSAQPSMTVDMLGGDNLVGVQKDTQAYWAILPVLGTEESMRIYNTLGEAFDALSKGEVKVVAADALVGGYMARDLSGVAYAGSAGPASPLGVAVRPDNTALSEAVRKSLDSLAADGVLDTVRRKWVGDLPRLDVPAETP
jgi:ABC-type amino acid transport substrate-binding protein